MVFTGLFCQAKSLLCLCTTIRTLEKHADTARLESFPHYSDHEVPPAIEMKMMEWKSSLGTNSVKDW